MSSAIRNDIETEAAEQKPRPSAGLWEWSRQCKVGVVGLMFPKASLSNFVNEN